MNYTKNDFFILATMRTLNATNPLGSIPIKTFIPATKLSHTKIRASLKLLMEDGYVSEGYKEYNAKTYYITKAGIEKINEIYEQNKDINKIYEKNKNLLYETEELSNDK